MSEKQEFLRRHSRSYVDERFLAQSHKISCCSNQPTFAMGSIHSKITINIQNTTKHDISKVRFQPIAKDILRKTSFQDNMVMIDTKLCGYKHIRTLNNRFRQIDKPTDVLSFPLIPLSKGNILDNKFSLSKIIPLQIGDIVICYEIAAKQAREHNLSTTQEIEKLFEHGLLHLLGFHHK